MWISTISESEATGDLASLYTRVRDPETGRLDNIMQVHGLHPAGLETHFTLYCAVMRGTKSLPRVDREMLALVVSRINACHY